MPYAPEDSRNISAHVSAYALGFGLAGPPEGEGSGVRG